MELGHLDKHSRTTQKRKAPQGKYHRCFCLETLKNCILKMRNFTHRRLQSEHIFPKLRHFFPIFEKGLGRPPPSLLVTRLCMLSANGCSFAVVIKSIPTFQCFLKFFSKCSTCFENYDIIH